MIKFSSESNFLYAINSELSRLEEEMIPVKQIVMSPLLIVWARALEAYSSLSSENINSNDVFLIQGYLYNVPITLSLVLPFQSFIVL